MPTLEEFAQTIKQKYPQYQNIDDRELGMKMIEKYPQYKEKVFDTDPEKQKMVYAQNPVEAIRTATPMDTSQPTEGVWDAIKKGGKNIVNNIVSSGKELGETLDTPTTGFAGNTMKQIKAGTGIATGLAQSVIAEPITTGLRAAGEGIQSATGYDINEQTAEGVQKLVQAGLDTETAQKTMEGYKQFKEENPEAGLAASALGDVAELMSYLVGYKGAKGTASATGDVIGSAGKRVKDAVTPAIEGTARKVAPTVGKAAEFGAAQTFGLKPETIKSIIKNPELFTTKEMSAINRDSVFNKVKTAVDKRLNDLSATGKGYEKIKNLPNEVNVSEKTVIDSLKNKGIDVTDGKIKVDLGSDIQLSKADIKGLEEVMSLIGGKGTLTPKEVLNLRGRLSELAKYGEGKTNASKTVAREIRSAVDEIAKKEIPGLNKLDSKFSKEIKLMNEAKKAIFKKDGTIKPNAISTITNLTGRGKEQLLPLMENIVPGITKDVNILKAVQDIQAAGSNKVGTYARTAMGVGTGAIAGGPVGAIIGMIMTSPQMAVKLLRAYAKYKNLPKQKVNSLINKMESGKKLVGNEVKIMNEAVDNAAKKVADRAKNGKAGLSIWDVGKKDKLYDFKYNGKTYRNADYETYQSWSNRAKDNNAKFEILKTKSPK